MKTTMMIMATMLTVSYANAQQIKESEVPNAVTESFNRNFKGAEVEKWEKEKNGTYEAEFDFNKIETSATYSDNGKLLETETEIAIKALPKSVIDYISKNYPNHKIAEAAKIIDDKGDVMYEAEAKKGKEEFDLLFDAKGVFVKKG
jgi:hypothetical protein